MVIPDRGRVLVHSKGKLAVEVRRLQPGDLEAVVAVYAASFSGAALRPREELLRKTRTLFFDGPLASDEVPSLVACNEAGEVVGFRGSLARGWKLDDERLRARCTTGQSVRADVRRMGVSYEMLRAAHLIREASAGEWIGMSDRGTADGTLFGSGTEQDTGAFRQLQQYGYGWEIPLRRPAAREGLWLAGGLRHAKDAARRIAHAFGDRSRARDVALPTSETLADSALSGQALLEVHEALAADFPLRADESVESWCWLFEYLADYPSRGRFRGRVWLDSAGGPIGFYVAYLDEAGRFDIGAFAVLRDRLAQAADQLLRDAGAAGAHTVQGWASANELRCFIQRGATVHAGRALAVTTSRADVLSRFEAMDAVFSGLEVERWI